MTRILLTHTPSARNNWYGEKALKGLAGLGELSLKEHEGAWTCDDLLSAAKSCDIIVADRATPIPAPVFERADKLLAVVRCAMDVRNIDIAAASSSGVVVTRAGPGFSLSVSEWIIGQMVNLARHIPDYILAYRDGRVPEPVMGQQLSGKTAGIIGFGHIGKTLAPVLESMGLRVLVNDPYVSVEMGSVEQVDFDDLLQQSDFVICLAVSNKETAGLMDASAFERMRNSAYFINPSRGELVDEEALEHALQSGLLAGAALDVGKDHDNYPPLALAQRSDVIATPHIGGMSPEAVDYQALQTVEQVRSILDGVVPDGALNPDAASRMASLGIKTR
ncbi:NAD(P)-dependent oxidoreductase [Halomonas sp. C05BenzN]|uniref:NAD(P)-dependent oxidoreductase n=1 Tax=Halomonas sp. C05BenzN TaxID=3411041 RepID=UPI003B94ABFB